MIRSPSDLPTMLPILPRGTDLPAALPTQSPDAAGNTVDFPTLLARSIDGVELSQQGADREAQKLALGQGNLHETALALEKADISMRVLVKARNKVVEAYQEVMRMNV